MGLAIRLVIIAIVYAFSCEFVGFIVLLFGLWFSMLFVACFFIFLFVVITLIICLLLRVITWFSLRVLSVVGLYALWILCEV